MQPLGEEMYKGRVKAEADALIVSIAEAEELPVVVYDTDTVCGSGKSYYKGI